MSSESEDLGGHSGGVTETAHSSIKNTRSKIKRIMESDDSGWKPKPRSMASTGVAVWSHKDQHFIPFIPCPGQKRVRLDVFDDLENYTVYKAHYNSDDSFVAAGALDDWEINYS